mgnify:CR=1 FL=1
MTGRIRAIEDFMTHLAHHGVCDETIQLVVSRKEMMAWASDVDFLSLCDIPWPVDLREGLKCYGPNGIVVWLRALS